MSTPEDHGALHETPPARPPAFDPRQFQRAGDAVEIPAAAAEGHPLYGIAGWAVVLAVLMVLDAIVFALGTIGSFILASRGAGGWFSVLALIQLGLLIWAIACIAKLFGKRADFPGQFTAMCVASATLTVLGMLIGGITWMSAIQLAVVALYIGYVQNSRRIRVTFRHQVESADPYLGQLFPEGLPDHLKLEASPWSTIGKVAPPAATSALRRPF
jgi:hypothetical protein